MDVEKTPGARMRKRREYSNSNLLKDDLVTRNEIKKDLVSLSYTTRETEMRVLVERVKIGCHTILFILQCC